MKEHALRQGYCQKRGQNEAPQKEVAPKRGAVGMKTPTRFVFLLFLLMAGCSPAPERSMKVQHRDIWDHSLEKQVRVRIIWDCDSLPDTLTIAMPKPSLRPRSKCPCGQNRQVAGGLLREVWLRDVRCPTGVPAP